MNVRAKFLGAAGSVTGSRHFLEIDDFKVLVDCGLFQGLKELSRITSYNVCYTKLLRYHNEQKGQS